MYKNHVSISPIVNCGVNILMYIHILGVAPYSTRRVTISSMPSRWASALQVSPSLFFTPVPAAKDSSSRTQSVCPFRIDRCNGVFCFLSSPTSISSSLSHSSCRTFSLPLSAAQCMGRRPFASTMSIFALNRSNVEAQFNSFKLAQTCNGVVCHGPNYWHARFCNNIFATASCPCSTATCNVRAHSCPYRRLSNNICNHGVSTRTRSTAFAHCKV